ncbi:MAG: trigger factor, trigger factor [Parcubacteria group bacterium GW2011_GWC1_43_12]|nr:MAG: Trigger factor [Parcubacteria group bacterium GW2011_GWB1_42_6]KKS92381.1 MAG: trigger factor, trigger factor [Parcubacteria group bacterium GW2011_GWC1_43_12]
MNITTKKLPHSEIEMLIELDPQEWGGFFNKAAKELSQNLEIPGFRPGKAPQNLAERHLGEGKILERAADSAIRDSYFKAAEREGIFPVSAPKIQVLKIAKGNSFEFKANVSVMPQIEIGDYKKISQGEKIKKPNEIKLDQKEIESAIEWIRNSRTKYAAVSRAARKGDRAEVDFAAKREGKIISEGESKNHPLVLGEGKFVPGFEEKLEGMKEGEEKKFSLIFPNDFHDKELANKQIDFEVKMKIVQEAQKPELNDEFAKSLGGFESFEALKKSVSEGMKKEKEQKEKESWRAKILEKIARNSKADIPAVLIDSELSKMEQEMEMSVSEMGLDFETYSRNIKKTREELKEEWLPKAKSRVMAALVLGEIAKKENINVPESEVEEEANKFLLRYPDIKAARNQIDMDRLKEYTRGSLVNEKVFKRLEEFSASA